MSANPLDRDLYTIIVGRRHAESVTIERGLDEMTEQQIVDAIDTGQIADVLDVIVSNPIEGWSRVVSADIAAKVMGQQLDDDGEIADWVVDFLEKHLGCEAVAVARREHAA